MITAEEFFRKKLKALKPNETSITLALHKIDAETAMLWSFEHTKEFAKALLEWSNKEEAEYETIDKFIDAFIEHLNNQQHKSE